MKSNINVYDGLKLGVKEPILPELSASGAFSTAPMIAFILSQVSFCVLFLSDSAYQGLILMALSSLAVYGVLLAGWASNSKYAFLGCLRSVALMVSYELGFGAALLSICLFLTDSTGMKSLNFAEASPFVQAALAPLLLLFLICILAESKRVPFDLPEAVLAPTPDITRLYQGYFSPDITRLYQGYFSPDITRLYQGYFSPGFPPTQKG